MRVTGLIIHSSCFSCLLIFVLSYLAAYSVIRFDGAYGHFYEERSIHVPRYTYACPIYIAYSRETIIYVPTLSTLEVRSTILVLAN